MLFNRSQNVHITTCGYIWCVGIYYYKAGDVIYWGQAAFAKYPLSHGVRLVAVQTLVVACRSGELGRTCCHGGWPGPPPMPHTTTAATATGTTAAVSIVSFTRARSRLLQHTAFYTRHTRSASSQRTGTATSKPYTAHTSRLSIVKIM